MTEAPQDSVDTILTNQLRTGLAAAAIVAEQLLRMREDAARQQAERAQETAAALQQRFEAERSLAHASVEGVHRDDWWARANPDRIASTWETARSWHGLDPEMDRAADRMRHELRDRYGLDVDQLDADPSAVAEAVQRRGLFMDAAAEQRRQASSEAAGGAFLVDDAQRHARRGEPREERDALDAAADAFDTVERRQEMASALDGIADGETIEARVVADTNQARPAREAVANPPRRAPRARRTRGAGPERQQRLER